MHCIFQSVRLVLAAKNIDYHLINIDPDDTPEMLKNYSATKKPPYEMFTDLSAADKELTLSFLAESMRIENPGLPSSIIADEEGNVLEVMQGIPNLSQVRRWKSRGK